MLEKVGKLKTVHTCELEWFCTQKLVLHKLTDLMCIFRLSYMDIRFVGEISIFDFYLYNHILDM